MNENDNKLLDKFFSQAAQQEIADNGFTERVRESIDAMAERRSTLRRAQRLWTLFCILVAVGLFLWLHDWNALASYVLLLITHLEVFLRTLPMAFDPSALSLSPNALTHDLLYEIVLPMIVLMVLSIIGLTRWANRLVS